MKHFLGIFFSFFLPTFLWACPFCEAGGRDTALFILVVFGFFATGALLLFFYAIRTGWMDSSEKLAAKPLEVEKKEPSHE